MKVILELEYPNDKIFKADTLPIRIVDLNYGIYFDGKAKIVHAIPIEFIERILAEHWYDDYDIRELLGDWEKENEDIRG